MRAKVGVERLHPAADLGFVAERLPAPSEAKRFRSKAALGSSRSTLQVLRFAAERLFFPRAARAMPLVTSVRALHKRLFFLHADH